jgi:hypothetical protein
MLLLLVVGMLTASAVLAASFAHQHSDRGATRSAL